jgi:preprotein translocase subunit SecA
MNFSRKELIQSDATMNQMRNAVYELARIMEKNGVSNLNQKLRRMGQEIAKTIINYWYPTKTVTLFNIKDVLATIYQKILNSSISIEIDELQNLIRVRDQNCALCKYHYDDIEIAGCEIIIGMVSEIISRISKESTENSSISFEPVEISESRAFGNKSCIQVYKYKTRA